MVEESTCCEAVRLVVSSDREEPETWDQLLDSTIPSTRSESRAKRSMAEIARNRLALTRCASSFSCGARHTEAGKEREEAVVTQKAGKSFPSSSDWSGGRYKLSASFSWER